MTDSNKGQSLNNLGYQVLIVEQCPETRLVASKSNWSKFNNFVTQTMSEDQVRKSI